MPIRFPCMNVSSHRRVGGTESVNSKLESIIFYCIENALLDEQCDLRYIFTDIEWDKHDTKHILSWYSKCCYH